MLVIRLLHLKGMPTYEDLINKSVTGQTEEISTQERVMQKVPNDESEVTKINNYISSPCLLYTSPSPRD